MTVRRPLVLVDGQYKQLPAGDSLEAAQAFFTPTTATATATGQTSFAVGAYTPGAIMVTLNGATLAPANYTATDGANVVLASGDGVVPGTELTVWKFSAFEVANALPLGGTAADASKLGGFSLPTDARKLWAFNPADGWVSIGNAPGVVQLPSLSGENTTFNDEGDSTTGWTASNATLSVSASYLRQTKTAAGASSSIAKAISSFTPANSDFILYGKVRAKNAADSNAVIWLLNGSKEISIWFGTANASSAISAGAISICGTTDASTRNVLQVATGADYQNSAIEFALHFDYIFGSLTCWFREADGRWKFKGRVACDWFSSSSITALTTTNSAAGSWIEFDYLTLARPNLAVIGDSIAEGKTLFSPDRSLSLTNDESTWMRHAALYPGLRNNLVVNKGVGGNTSAQMQARIADVTGTGARVVFLHASSNDYVAGVSQSARTTTTQGIIDAIVASGAQAVLLNAVYGTQADTNNPGQRDYALAWWNGDRSTLTDLSAAIDIMAPLVDANGYMTTSLTQSDGIHPTSPAGYAAIGEYVASFG